MKYVEVLKRDRSEVESLLRSPNPNDVMDGLLSAAYHDTDWKWVQGECLAHLAHNERSVRRLSATCLGHVARIHKQLDLELVLPRLLRLEDDPDVGGNVQDALDDIRVYLRFQ
jgi:hypothetical protein